MFEVGNWALGIGHWEEGEAEPLDMRYQAEPGNEKLCCDRCKIAVVDRLLPEA